MFSPIGATSVVLLCLLRRLVGEVNTFPSPEVYGCCPRFECFVLASAGILRMRPRGIKLSMGHLIISTGSPDKINNENYILGEHDIFRVHRKTNLCQSVKQYEAV